MMLLSINVFANDGQVISLSLDDIALNGKTFNFNTDNKNKDNVFSMSYGSNADFDVSLGLSSLYVNRTFTLTIGSDLEVLDIKAISATVTKISDTEYSIKMIKQITTGTGLNNNGIYIYINNDKAPDLLPKFSSNMNSITVSWFRYLDYFKDISFYVDGDLYKTINGTYEKITIDNLIPNKTYKIRIRGEPNSPFKSVYDKTFDVSTSNIVWNIEQEITYDSNTIKFLDMGIPNASYEIKFQNKVYPVSSDSYIIENLNPKTNYSFSLRFLVDGKASNWEVFSFKTLSYDGPPKDITSLRLVDRGEDFITVKVDSKYADRYKYSLDDVFISDEESNIFTFDGLNYNTEYKIGVIAYNDKGETPEYFDVFATENLPNALISGLSASIVDSTIPTLRNLKWSSSNVKDGIKISFDGVEITTLDSDVKNYEVDFSDYGYTEDSTVKVDVFPLDNKGTGSSILVDLSYKGVGYPFIDSIIIAILNGIDLMLSAGVSLLLVLIPFIIIFIAIRILFNRYKVDVNDTLRKGYRSSRINEKFEEDNSYFDKSCFSSGVQFNSYEEWKKEFNNLNDGTRSLHEIAEQIEVVKNSNSGSNMVSNSNHDDKRTSSLMNEVSRLR